MILSRLRSPAQALLRLNNQRRDARFETKLAKLLADAMPPKTIAAEVNFESLQSRYRPRPEYGYDPASLFCRALDRSKYLVEKAGLGSDEMRGLELGAGDGMLSRLLSAFGHSMLLTDIADWRAGPARNLDFCKADCCERLPLDDSTFDFVVSYNSFEHFPDPERAFSEVLRVSKRGAILVFSFNPLYCSPWGLHAYRTLRMPYPQFLFSEDFIEQKLRQLGIWDLGEKRAELQSLNRWRPSQFEALWTQDSVAVVSCQWHFETRHLRLVEEFPECFRGRGLTVNDLTKAGVLVVLQKK